jgi:hypothetical protein
LPYDHLADRRYGERSRYRSRQPAALAPGR